MPHPYDQISKEALRRQAGVKWRHYPEDVLPLWVADMDFPIAEPIRDALVRHAREGGFGYPSLDGLPGLKESALERLSSSYAWRPEREHLHILNGIVTGLYLGCLACSSEGEEVIMQSPIYPPFISAVEETRRVARYNGLIRTERGWEIDFEGLERLVTPATRLLMLCNPHNPTGRVYRRDELEGLADFALRHRLWIVSDELHSDLVYPGHPHIPIASLSPEVSARTLTLFGPTKTFNIAGLKLGFAVSENIALLERFKRLAHGLVGQPNVMAQAATMAAYRDGQAWLEQTLGYLDGNRRYLGEALPRAIPQVDYRLPEGTYLAWLDFRGLNLGESLHDFLLEDCQVGLNDGVLYGPGGDGFARLNFATSRALVEEALERIRAGLAGRLD